jgi:hypothetical protein
MEESNVKVTDEFISKNKFKLRTQEEISQKIEEYAKEPNLFDFRPEVLVQHLEWDLAKKCLTDEYVAKVEKGEEKYEYITDIKVVVKDFLDYMVFAWGKAEDERGLSATRSIQKLSAWLWLLNRDDLVSVITDDDLYNPYGSPALIEVCNQIGVEVPNSLIEFAQIKQ